MNLEKYKGLYSVAALLFILCAGVTAQSITGQQSSGSRASSASAPAPTYLLYHLFFRHLTELHNSAFSANGGPASPSSTDRALLYKHVLALKDSEYKALLTVAKNCEDSVAQDDAQAREIIKEARSRYPGGKIPAGESLPAVPDSLKALQAHRNGVINDAILNLHQQLSSASAHQIDGFISNHFGSKSHMKQLSLPSSGKLPILGLSGSKATGNR